MVLNIIAVGFGGLFGSIARYLISHYFSQFSQLSYPWATTIVNLLGSIIIGCLIALFENGLDISNELKLLIIVGFCGGFTTFSTFSLEFIKLIDKGQFLIATSYLLINVFIGIILCFISYKIFK